MSCVLAPMAPNTSKRHGGCRFAGCAPRRNAVAHVGGFHWWPSSQHFRGTVPTLVAGYQPAVLPARPAPACRPSLRPAGLESCLPGMGPGGRYSGARIRPLSSLQRPAGMPSCRPPRTRTRPPGTGAPLTGSLGAGAGKLVVDHGACAPRQRLADRRLSQPSRPPFVPAGILHRRGMGGLGVLPDFDVFYGRPRTSPAASRPWPPCPPHGLVYQPRQGVDAAPGPPQPQRPQSAVAFFVPL